ncbi:Fur family transcriptional regulator [Gulosibacter chungangensis]|uniref:Transcriptional repressor n=1 Tax=Gulosibacter chungangensis TaxID=979746 RepID=A0A7J5BEM5_9MICO|nr:Fur family transcriptional regulator [Gulosibacter chungangensis]KAB1644723.1 transcriptional repressor [Gulosibacter chungangensis]
MTDREQHSWTDRLRAAGLRVTSRRLALLEALEAHPHASVDEVFHHTAARVPSLTKQAVYVSLDDFVASGLIRRLDGSPARYETRTDDNHHHLICDDCGKIIDVDCAIGEAPCMFPHADGFNVRVAEVTYRGQCPECAAVPIAS